MRYLNYIFLTYFLALISLPVSNLLRLDVQQLFRLPYIDIRYFDIALLLLLLVTFSSNFILTIKSRSKVSILILVFGIFLIINFIRTIGKIELNAQIGFLLAYLSLFIIYYITNYFDKKDILLFIKKKYILIIFLVFSLQLSTLFLFFSGQSIIHDDVMGKRILFDVIGSKETIGVHNVIVFSFLLALFNQELFGNKKFLKLFSLLFIIIVIITTTLSFHRGLTFSIIFCVLSYLFFISKNRIRTIVITILIIILSSSFLIIYEEEFIKVGVNPVENFLSTIEYGIDTKNLNWDKGRELSRIIGIQIWLDNFWLGMGFDYMFKYTSYQEIATPHHLVISSLMFNGLIGTILFIGIYIIFYWKTFRLFRKVLSGKVKEEDRVISLILIITAILWLIPALTQEVQFERYSSSIQYIFFGAIIKLDDYYEGIINEQKI